MKSKEIVFKLNSTICIILYLPVEEIDKLDMFDEVSIRFFYKGNIYNLYDKDFAIHSIRSLNTLLKHSLNKKNFLHSSINKDIGYLWNQYVQDKDLEQMIIEDQQYWIGQNYLVWNSLSHYDTWLYNKNNKIIFQVTRSYPWTFEDPKATDNFTTYEEFIKSYKPLIIFELSKKVTQEWLNETQKLISIMEKNYEQWLATKDQ